MTGEIHLEKLLENMSPELVPGDFVFCTLPEDREPPVKGVIGQFREEEGISIIVRQEIAEENGLIYDGIMAWITLSVHSSLQAVGLTAAVSTALAGAGISCNVVAAYYHDHLFVSRSDAERVLLILQGLTTNSGS